MRNTLTAGICAALLASCTSAPEAAAHPGTPSNRFADPEVIDEAFPPGLAEVFFDSHGDRLNGHIYLANGAGPHPTVILLHGFPGNEKNLDLAQAQRRDGFNVLFFHYRGALGSEGTYTFNHVIEHVGAAADFLRANAEVYRVDPAKLITIGHSLGGFASLHGAARDPAILCGACIAPANFGARASLLQSDPDAVAGFKAYADSLQMLAGFSGETGLAELAANAEAFDLRSLAPRFAGRNALIVAAKQDTTIPLEQEIEPVIRAFAVEPGVNVTVDVLPGDHSFSWSRGALINAVAD